MSPWLKDLLVGLDDEQILPQSEEVSILVYDIFIALSGLIWAFVNDEWSFVFTLKFT